jgi:FtsP/CotA-like multicopper oxidase with cupredoxin domain
VTFGILRHLDHLGRAAALSAALALTASVPLAAQRPCDPAPLFPGPSHDLYCIHLFPALGATASGTAQLDWIPGPFTANVAEDGTNRWRLTFTLDSLPPLPDGPAPGYVAWVMPQSLEPVTRLGTVRRGTTELGPFALQRFLVHVSAEPDTNATTRQGRLLLRGESAGTRLRPADNYEFFLGGIGVPRDAADHAHHMESMPDSLGWTGVPMYPGLDMLLSEMRLRPPVHPWLPPASPNAPAARPREMVTLADGDTLNLTAGLVNRVLAGRAYTMFGFNGQYPGPLLRVPQGARVTVRFHNDLPQPSTVHWHGLRLDFRFDGVPDLTQPPVQPGEVFTYQLVFPDGGIFWYHPHVREDIQQDLGLYGNIFVQPARADMYGPVHREEFLILDDLLIGENGLVPWGEEAPTHALMGRFGNVLLVNGEPAWKLAVSRGEVLRFFLTNVSNTRTFNLSFGPGTRLKMVGSDLGNFARQTWVGSVVIGPAERYVVEVRFDRPGSVAMINAVQGQDHMNGRFFPIVDTLGLVTVGPAAAQPTLESTFATLRTDQAVEAEVAPLLRANQGRPPEYILELRATFADLPYVTRRLMRVDSLYHNPVEWAGTMPGMNFAAIGPQARWTLRDRATGRENHDIDWRFKVGDRVRVRLVNVRETLHAMQHPIHLHGQRFLILAVNGVPNDDPAWKDTVLVPAGSAVDLLVEMSNPGPWMLHCHIAEHLQAGMMMTVNVEQP